MSVGCILLIIFFLFCAFAVLPQPVNAQNTVTATIPVAGTVGVAMAPNGDYVYVVGGSSVFVISTATNSVTATVPVGGCPLQVAVTPNGEYAYVTDDGNNTVSVISTARNNVTATIPVGSDATGVAVTPNGAYVML